ncbi:peptidase [Chitinophaga lutea]|uniref:Peptidase n=1 Tax=Chitinophaga lutea TaxID=2488634 RepID=A0A3N4PNP4_9BACT|nr:type II toxin-antitoxin system RelE/ParE family toxin [Chitinophaga lutea]RPE09425.1 peptidase [Chitinophaga lutea]
MIKHFKSKALRAFWEHDKKSGLPAQHTGKIRRILYVLDIAAMPEDMQAEASWKAHPLKGPMQGYWSIWVSGNYRIVFLFKDGHAYEVDYIDYH